MSCTGQIDIEGRAGVLPPRRPPGESAGVEEVVGDPNEGGRFERAPSELQRELSLDDFSSQEYCSACHPQQADEWSSSAHAHSMTDPVFRALVARADEDGSETRAFCLSCHTNIGTVTRSVGAGLSFESFDDLVSEGVTCESCHRMTEVLRPRNAEHQLDPTQPMQGTARVGEGSRVHPVEPSTVLASAELCGSCHDVYGNGGVALEQPYFEWSSSPARNDGYVCIDCHMSRAFGVSAVGFDLSPRPRRDHSFLGPGALATLAEQPAERATEIEAEVRAQLQEALSLELVAPRVTLPETNVVVGVLVASHVSGHRFPTGSAFFRQVWVELQVSDGTGSVVFDTQRLPGQNSPATAEASQLWLSATLLDEHDEPTLFPWRARRIDNDATLPPLAERAVALSFPVPRDAQRELRLHASVQFRTFPPELLSELGLDPALAIVVELAEADAVIELRSGAEDLVQSAQP